MCYRTLEQWNARGRQVKKGEKAAGRLNDNTPLFGKSQTKKMPKQSQRASYTHHTERTVTNWNQSLDWDECHEFGLDIGLPGQWWDSHFISVSQWVGQAHFFSTPHPCRRQVSYILPISIPHTNIIDKPARVFIQYVITATPLPDCYPHPPHTTRRVLHCVQVHFQKYPCKISDVTWQVVNLCEFVMYLSLKG